MRLPLTPAWFGCLLLVASAVPVHANPASVEPVSQEVRATATALSAEEPAGSEWVTIIGAEGASGVAGLGRNLAECGGVSTDEDSNHLTTHPGVGVVAASRKFGYRDDNNLTSAAHFGDCEVTLEFNIGKGSNSGVKLQGRYEIQIYDSWNKDELSGDDCGGVYPHWVYAPSGRGIEYTDNGVPPLRNASKVPGEWQALHIVFRAPRFDSRGDKVENARFISVVLNGQVVQQDVEVDSPTGNAADPLPEVPKGPLFLQMDHGPVAFRKVKVKPL